MKSLYPASFLICYRLFAAGLLLAVCTGCGGTYDSSVAGVVTLDGIPLERGVVAFYPKQHGPIGHGVIKSDGSYEVMVGREAGLPPGEYDVTVVSTEASAERTGGSGPPPPGRTLTPEHVGARSTTDLHYTVEPGDNRIDLQLNSQD